MIDKWAVRWFELAQHVAAWSKDPDTKVGAVLVSGADIRQTTFGYNGPPPGIKDLPERFVRPAKYLFAQHAERNVLDNARFSCTGATLATTMFPCVECTKSMVSKGVKRLITPRMPEPLASGEWSWRNDCPTSLLMLKEANVRVTWMDVKKTFVEQSTEVCEVWTPMEEHVVLCQGDHIGY